MITSVVITTLSKLVSKDSQVSVGLYIPIFAACETVPGTNYAVNRNHANKKER